MKLEFDFNSVTDTEFGIGLGEINSPTFRRVSAKPDVQIALREMVQETWEAIEKHEVGPQEFEPSEKHSGTEYLFVRHSEIQDTFFRNLHEAQNMTRDASAINHPSRIFCYFTRIKDKHGCKVTGLRRAGQFKGILKNKLLSWRNGLQIVEEKVFRLDNDFDLLIDSEYVHVWRPSSFVILGEMKKAILDAAPRNISLIKQDLPFVDYGNITKYAKKSIRAAGYLASIRGHQLEGIDCQTLMLECKKFGVEVEYVQASGKITVADEKIMDFLKVLDRRLFSVELVPGEPESYLASSRTKFQA